MATDVDGTLLDDAGGVTPRTGRVIERLVEAGAGFVLVTGRPPRWTPPIAALVGAVRYAVCANGAVLYDILEDRIIWSRTLPAEALAELATAATELLPGATLAVERVGEGAFDAGIAHFAAEPDYEHAWPEADNSSEARQELLAHPAVKLLIRHPGMTSDAMIAALAPSVAGVVDLTFSHSGGLVEASPAGVTKATGLAVVASRTGLDAADLIAFGDMPNDLEMLRWAGHGVAMGNAHPVLKAVADEVTGSNEEDGLALVLERWF
ncbi:MAG: HAD family hydrolase [Pseudonocardia sp.]|nr:HAD family hydrolase [Pseudonocardia sp.]